MWKTSTILTIALAVIMTSCNPSGKRNMEKLSPSKENKTLVQNTYDDKGIKGIFDLLDENVEWTVTGRAPFSGTYRGKKQFVEKAVQPINDFLETPISPKLISLTAEDNVVWMNWKGSAMAKNGSEYVNQYAWMLVLKDEKIVKVTAFLDTYELANLVE